MKTKVKLSSLKIESFVTDLDRNLNDQIKGGASGSGSCDGGSASKTWYNTSCVIH